MWVSGRWTESYQARRFFAARAAMDEALILWLAWRRRANLPVPRWVVPVVGVGGLASLGVKVTYDDQIRRFWNEIRAGWQAHELVLEEDPRNGQTCSWPGCRTPVLAWLRVTCRC
jgi:hypothetical protein